MIKQSKFIIYSFILLCTIAIAKDVGGYGYGVLSLGYFPYIYLLTAYIVSVTYIIWTANIEIENDIFKDVLLINNIMYLFLMLVRSNSIHSVGKYLLENEGLIPVKYIIVYLVCISLIIYSIYSLLKLNKNINMIVPFVYFYFNMVYELYRNAVEETGMVKKFVYLSFIIFIFYCICYVSYLVIKKLDFKLENFNYNNKNS